MLQAVRLHAIRSAHPCADCSLTPTPLLPGTREAVLRHFPDSPCACPRLQRCHRPTEPSRLSPESCCWDIVNLTRYKKHAAREPARNPLSARRALPSMHTAACRGRCQALLAIQAPALRE
jgi:hypothetical protein